MTRKRTKKRNANDATQRNVRASKKRDEALNRRVRRLEGKVTLLGMAVKKLIDLEQARLNERAPVYAAVMAVEEKPKRRGR